MKTAYLSTSANDEPNTLLVSNFFSATCKESKVHVLIEFYSKPI